MMEKERESVVLTTPAAAKIVGLSISAMTKMRLLGTGPAYLRLGGAIRYRRADLERWMDANVCVTTSEYSRRRA